MVIHIENTENDMMKRWNFYLNAPINRKRKRKALFSK